MTPDTAVNADDELRNLLKKSINRLHAVKDDLRRCDQLDSDGDGWYSVIAGRTAAVIHDLNRYAAERRS